MTPAEIVTFLLQNDAPDARQRVLTKFAPHLNLDLLRHLADLTYNTQFKNAQEALTVAQLGLQIAEKIDAPAALAMAQWNLGNVHHLRNNYDEALDCFAQAQVIYEAGGQARQAVALKINRVGIFCARGQYAEALPLAEEAEAACLSIGEAAEPYLANLQLTLGWIHEEMGDFETALEVYAYGRSLFTKNDDSIRVAMIDVNRAHLFKAMDDFAQAEALLHAARQVLARDDYVQEVARVDLNLGLLAHGQGRYQQALAILQAAYDGFAQIPLPVEMANVNLARSDVYSQLNLHAEMVEMAAEAAAVFRRQHMKREFTRCLVNQAVGYLRLGLWHSAERFLTRARRQARKHSTPYRLAAIDLYRAELALHTQQPQRAYRIAQRLARQHQQLQKPSLLARARILQAQSNVQLPAPRYEQAALWLAEAAEIAARYQLVDLQIEAQRLLAEISIALADFVRAEQYYRHAFALVEQLRLHFTVDELQLGYLENQRAVFYDRLAFVHQQYVAGRGTLANLLETLQASSQAALPLRLAGQQEHTAVPDLDDLKAEWHWYVNRLEAAETQVEWAVLQTKLQTVERKLGQQHRQRRLSGLVSPTVQQPADLGSLQAHLATGEGLLLFYEALGAVQAMVITAQEGEVIQDVVPVPQLSEQLSAWRLFLQHAAGQPDFPPVLVEAHLQRLYHSLIRPLASTLAGLHHLFVVLPAAWHDLPLAGLFDGDLYLVQQYSLTFLSTPQQLLAAKTRQIQSDHKGVLVGFSGNGRLPAAVQEVQAIAAQLAATWDVRRLLESNANVLMVQQQAVSASLLHLATHVEFRPDNSLFSWIELADARLTAADIYQWQLRKRPLVVLSACESGRGQAHGSGLLGLGRSFLAAGAAELLLSLWRIEDMSTADLMLNFYQTWSNHAVGTAQSLQQAQQWAVAQQLSPLVWASLIHLAG